MYINNMEHRLLLPPHRSIRWENASSHNIYIYGTYGGDNIIVYNNIIYNIAYIMCHNIIISANSWIMAWHSNGSNNINMWIIIIAKTTYNNISIIAYGNNNNGSNNITHMDVCTHGIDNNSGHNNNSMYGA